MMYKRALMNYTDINDIKRVIVNTHMLKKEEVVDFLDKQTAKIVMICLNELLKSSRSNLEIVVACAVNLGDKEPITNIAKLFEQYGEF